MRKDWKRQLDMFDRVVTFIECNAERCDRARGSGTYGELRSHIAEIRAGLARRDALNAERRAETRRLNELRAVLQRDHMVPIARISAASVDPRGERTALAMPRRWAGPYELIRHASEMAVVSRSHTQEFLRAGLPRTFQELLVAAIEAFGRSVGQRDRVAQASVAETAFIAERLKRGVAAVQVLDAMVRSAGAGDASFVAAWREAVRVADRVERRNQPAGGLRTALVPVESAPGERPRSWEWRRLLESMRGAVVGMWRRVAVLHIGAGAGANRPVGRLSPPSELRLPATER